LSALPRHWLAGDSGKCVSAPAVRVLPLLITMAGYATRRQDRSPRCMENTERGQNRLAGSPCATTAPVGLGTRSTRSLASRNLGVAKDLSGLHRSARPARQETRARRPALAGHQRTCRRVSCIRFDDLSIMSAMGHLRGSPPSWRRGAFDARGPQAH